MTGARDLPSLASVFLPQGVTLPASRGMPEGGIQVEQDRRPQAPGWAYGAGCPGLAAVASVRQSVLSTLASPPVTCEQGSVPFEVRGGSAGMWLHQAQYLLSGGAGAPGGWLVPAWSPPGQVHPLPTLWLAQSSQAPGQGGRVPRFQQARAVVSLLGLRRCLLLWLRAPHLSAPDSRWKGGSPLRTLPSHTGAHSSRVPATPPGLAFEASRRVLRFPFQPHFLSHPTMTQHFNHGMWHPRLQSSRPVWGCDRDRQSPNEGASAEGHGCLAVLNRVGT